MAKTIKLNIILFVAILIVITLSSFFLGTKKSSELNTNSKLSNESIWEKSVARVHFTYPNDKFRIYEPEPYPGDNSVLSNFDLLSTKNDESVITGEFWNETMRSGTKDALAYAAKNKLERVTIGKYLNEQGAGYDIDAYLFSGKENGTYTYLVQSNNELYVLTLTIQDQYLNNNDVKKVILTARPY